GPAGFDAAIASARASLEATLADGSGAGLLVPGLATGTPVPTPDGGILLFHHELVIYSDDARTLEIEAAPQMQLSWVRPTALAAGLESGEFRLEPCTSLAGGVIATDELRRLEVAVDGSTLAIGSAEGGAIVWRKAPGPGCDWVPIAELDRVDAIVLAPGSLDPPSRSVAARAELDEGGSRVLVWALADDLEPEGELLEPQVLIEQSSRRFGAPTFLDDRHLAVPSTALAEQPEHRVYLLDRTRPGVYLSLPVEFFAEGRSLREVFALAPAS